MLGVRPKWRVWHMNNKSIIRIPAALHKGRCHSRVATKMKIYKTRHCIPLHKTFKFSLWFVAISFHRKSDHWSSKSRKSREDVLVQVHFNNWKNQSVDISFTGCIIFTHNYRWNGSRESNSPSGTNNDFVAWKIKKKKTSHEWHVWPRISPMIAGKSTQTFRGVTCEQQEWIMKTWGPKTSQMNTHNCYSVVVAERSKQTLQTPN